MTGAPVRIDDLAATFDRLIAGVEDAARVVEGGGHADLSGLDHQINAACAAAVAAGAAGRGALLPRLADLIGRLDRLAEALRRRHPDGDAEAARAAARRRAARVYGSAPGTGRQE